MKIDYSDFSKSLPEFGPTADKLATSANQSLLALGLILLGLFFLLELMSWNQHMKSRGNGLTKKLWLEIGFKYLVAFVLIVYSAPILDGLGWILNGAIRLALKGVQMVNPADLEYKFEIGGVKGWIKNVIILVGQGTEAVANVVVYIVNFLRYLELYVLKAIAPVLIACFMSDTLRSVTINFFKTYASYFILALLMTLVSIIYPAMITDDLLKLAMPDANATQLAFMSIAKGIIYIMAIVGTGRKAKQLLGV
ncbi:type IV secretion system protein [Streptococcus sp. S784/96/1]|uniref:type IV secretion system protein n=1 Tax=Streptococcus sp. S784/96/1 TaxID=2653499 RepID=UPI0013875A86|nr:type IV secretion system protein [Streptococcus sp. S784/96/1]